MAKTAARLRSVFEFEDFREFMKVRVQELADAPEQISLRSLCKKAGFASPGLYHYVVQGKRPLRFEAAKKFAKGMGLSKSETEFFLILVEYQQAEDGDQKLRLHQRLLGFKSFREAHPLSQAQFEYYTRWYYPVIREMVGLKNFKESAAWIASRLRPAIHPEDVTRALERLQILGLLGRNDKGRLVQTNPRVATTNLVTSHLVAQFHREMLKIAQESLKSFTSDEREISGITLALDQTRQAQLKEKLRGFLAEVFSEFGEPTDLDEQVFQLNLQFFPLSAD